VAAARLASLVASCSKFRRSKRQHASPDMPCNAS
jgi:hypothetical protein